MSLIHWWPLNGDTKDYGCNVINLTNTNAVINNTGKIGKCYTFTNSGTSASQYMNASISVPNTTFTVACWINTTTLLNSGSFNYIMALNGGGPTDMQFGLGYRNMTSWCFVTNSHELTFNYTHNTGVWYHLVGVLDEGAVRLYVNGELIGSGTSTGTNTHTNFYVGCRYSKSYPVSGNINDIRIYDHALSQLEVRELAKGCVLHYDFEDPYIEECYNLDYNRWPNYVPAAYNGTYTNLTNETFRGEKIIRCTGTSATNSGFNYSNDITIMPGESVTQSLWIRWNGTPFVFSSYNGGYDTSGTYQDPYISLNINGTYTDRRNARETIEIYDEYDNKIVWTNVKANTWYRFCTIITNNNTANIRITNWYYLGGANTCTWDISCVQKERNDHATPYVEFSNESTINLWGDRTALQTYWGGSHVGSGANFSRNEDYVSLPGNGNISGQTTQCYIHHSSSLVNIKPNTTYTISIQALIGTGSRFRIYWYEKDINGATVITRTKDFTTVSSDYQWQVFTVTTAATTAKAYIELNNINGVLDSVLLLKCNTLQVEEKNHRTNWTSGTRNMICYDTSGYNRHGDVYGTPPVLSDSGKGQYSLTLNKSGDYIELPNMSFVTTGTLSMWARYNTDNYKMIFGSDDSGGLFLAARSNANWYSSGCGTLTYYRDGVQTATPLFDGKWHNYVIIGINFSSWSAREFFLCMYANQPSNSFQFHGDIADLQIYNTILTTSDILTLYQRKAAIGKNGSLLTSKIIENGTSTTPNITKNNCITAGSFSENLLTKVEADGSVWLRIYKFDYDIAGSIWTSTTAKLCDTAGKFSVLGSLNDFIPDNGWYEFYYTEHDPSQYIRWKQSYNPLSRVTSGTSGTSSEYTFIAGTTPYSGFSGLTRYTSDDSSSCYLRGAISWWCAIAPYQTSYDVFPDMWGNSTNNHKQELWIRIDNMKSTPFIGLNKVEIGKTSYNAFEIIEN